MIWSYMYVLGVACMIGGQGGIFTALGVCVVISLGIVVPWSAPCAVCQCLLHLSYSLLHVCVSTCLWHYNVSEPPVLK